MSPDIAPARHSQNLISAAQWWQKRSTEVKEQIRKVFAMEEYCIGDLTFGKESIRGQRGPAGP